ncbi:MAG: hypothetical protein PHU04_00615 [Candidatus Peribacteraceae bacterium]|nr:hypothetical protein [Candidatus Peribacteraceae bacterium]
MGLLTGILLALLAVTFLQGKSPHLTAQFSAGNPEDHYPILGACGRSEHLNLFRWVPPQELGEGEEDVIDIWSREYNERVNVIVEEYRSMDGSEIDCLSDSLETLLPAGRNMLALAGQLPPWEDPQDLAQLSYMDTNTVLLEHLRMYECALVGRYFYLFGDVMKEMQAIYGQKDAILWWGNVFREFQKQERKIRHEIAVSRTSLNRVLLLLNGYGRLRSLEMEVECFDRATKDFRNALAAAAEASACLPRAWDAKDPMRDLK